jgi:hypothetical protein
MTLPLCGGAVGAAFLASHGHFTFQEVEGFLQRADAPAETGLEPPGLVLVFEGQD